MSDSDGVQSVLRSLVSWMKTLEDSTNGKANVDQIQTSSGAQEKHGNYSDGILQDPRAVPLLRVLRSEALQIIGEVCIQ
jgi:hypothetical protein